MDCSQLRCGTGTTRPHLEGTSPNHGLLECLSITPAHRFAVGGSINLLLPHVPPGRYRQVDAPCRRMGATHEYFAACSSCLSHTGRPVHGDGGLLASILGLRTVACQCA